MMLLTYFISPEDGTSAHLNQDDEGAYLIKLSGSGDVISEKTRSFIIIDLDYSLCTCAYRGCNSRTFEHVNKSCAKICCLHDIHVHTRPRRYHELTSILESADGLSDLNSLQFLAQ